MFVAISLGIRIAFQLDRAGEDIHFNLTDGVRAKFHSRPTVRVTDGGAGVDSA